MASILPWFSDFWFFVIIGIILIIIYYFIPKELKISINKFLSGYLFWIIIFIVLIYGWSRWGYVRDHDFPAGWRYAAFLCIFGGMIYLAVNNWLYEHRYNSTHFSSNGCSGSCSLRYDIGKWTIFYLGTSGTSDWKGLVIPWYFPQKICVVPKDSWDFNGSDQISITQTYKKDIKYLPPKARHKIEQDKRTFFARNNAEIYFGVFSEKLMTDDPKYSEISAEMEETNAAYDKLEEEFDNVTGNSERYAGHIRRMKKTYADDYSRQQPRQAEEQ